MVLRTVTTMSCKKSRYFTATDNLANQLLKLSQSV
jgi:hypothetical protein